MIPAAVLAERLLETAYQKTISGSLAWIQLPDDVWEDSGRVKSTKRFAGQIGEEFRLECSEYVPSPNLMNPAPDQREIVLRRGNDSVLLWNGGSGIGNDLCGLVQEGRTGRELLESAYTTLTGEDRP